MLRAGLLTLALLAGACDVVHLDVLRVSPDGDGGRDGSSVGPIVRYRFDEGAGRRVLDSSAGGALLHLVVEDPDHVTWLDGALRIDAPTVIASDAPAEALAAACQRSNALTVEAWVVPASTVVAGTHRIVTLSASTTERDFTLGQGALSSDPPTDAYVFRLRTSDTGENGLPALSSEPGVVRTRLAHLVATHGPDGTDVLYVDGEVAARREGPGDLSTWDGGYRLALADELDQAMPTRAWLGELHYVAVYDRALSAAEVASHFASGPE